MSLPRTLYYLALSRIAGKSVFLNPRKRKLFEDLEKKVLPGFVQYVDSLAAIQGVVDYPIRQRVEHEMAMAGTKVQSFEIPRIPSYICNFAVKGNISILEATLTIREMDTAKEFRRWMAKLETSLLSDDRGSNIKSAQILNEIGRAASGWADALDAMAGVEYETRKADFSVIPHVGWLLKLAGIKDYNYRAPLLSGPPSYLTFIAQWYS